MTGALRGYIRIIDGFNYRVGRIMMYGIFVMMAILLYSSASKIMGTPSLWTLEMAQFAMVAYYMIGGPYSIQMGSNVRMDLLYAEWSTRTKAWVDAITVLALIFYLGVLLYGAYSLGHFGGSPIAFFSELFHAFFTGGTEAAGEVLGFIERTASPWRPVVWPVKFLMCIGVFLMLLQAIAEFFRDILRLTGDAV